MVLEAVTWQAVTPSAGFAFSDPVEKTTNEIGPKNENNPYCANSSSLHVFFPVKLMDFEQLGHTPRGFSYTNGRPSLLSPLLALIGSPSNFESLGWNLPKKLVFGRNGPFSDF